MHSPPFLRSFPSITFETALVFIWMTVALSRPLKEDCRALPLFILPSPRRLTMWCPLGFHSLVGSQLLQHCCSINQSLFYVMSVHIKVILDKKLNKTKNIIILYYTILPTGLWTINLTIELIISALYKISLTLLQALKSYPFFLNNSVVIGHSSLTDIFTNASHILWIFSVSWI